MNSSHVFSLPSSSLRSRENRTWLWYLNIWENFISIVAQVTHSFCPSFDFWYLILCFRSAFLNAGYRVSLSHCAKDSIKTDAPSSFMWVRTACALSYNLMVVYIVHYFVTILLKTSQWNLWIKEYVLYNVSNWTQFFEKSQLRLTFYFIQKRFLAN